MDHRIYHLCEKDHFLSALNIVAEVNISNDTQISARTVRRRLEDFKLRGQKLRKKPMLSTGLVLKIEKCDLHLLKLINIRQIKIGKKFYFRTNRNSTVSFLMDYDILDVELAKSKTAMHFADF